MDTSGRGSGEKSPGAARSPGPAAEGLPYPSRPGPDLRDAQDSIVVNGGRKSMLKARRNPSGAGYIGSITMGVDRR